LPVAAFLTEISTVPYRQEGGFSIRGIPQGSPHAMHLYNRVLFPLDDKVSSSAVARGMRYTRWVDDFTITSPNDSNFGNFAGAVQMVGKYFKISPGKTYFQRNPLFFPDESWGDLDGVYLLGHIVNGTGLTKNSDEKRQTYKVAPVKLEDLTAIPSW
jgi:hypothetical protein